MDITHVKIEVYVPETHIDQVKDAMFAADAGHVGSYDGVFALYKVEGGWRPLVGSNPYQGETGKPSTVTEYKIEMRCETVYVARVMASIHSAHPYEEPLINVIPLLNHRFGIQ